MGGSSPGMTCWWIPERTDGDATVVARKGQGKTKTTLASRHVEAFLEMLAAERGAAALTIDAYRRDLLDFASFLARTGIDVEAADAAALRRYFAALAGAATAPPPPPRPLPPSRPFPKFLLSPRGR